MAKLSSYVTEDNVKTIISIALKVTESFQKKSASWKNKTVPTMVGAILAVLVMAVCLIYFIVTHHITPLMIYTACTIPILAFALTLFSKNLDSIHKEFREFTDAFKNLMGCLKSSSDLSEDEAVAAVSTTLMATANLTEDQLNEMTFSQIKALPQYEKACQYVASLKNIKSAVAQLKEEGQDVDNILSTLDVDGYATDELYEDTSVWSGTTGTS